MIINRSDTGTGNFDFEFNYASIQWETGDADGQYGFGGFSARVGFSNDLGVSYEFLGSGVNDALLDDSFTPETALIQNSMCSTVPGRYVFQVRNNVFIPFAYWMGQSGNNWNAFNWGQDEEGVNELPYVPDALTDVVFSALGSSAPLTVLDEDFAIHSLTVDDSRPVFISGSAHTLTLTNGCVVTYSGRTGITVNAGAGAVTIASNLALEEGNETIRTKGTAQLTLAGSVDGSRLVKRGAGTLNVTGTMDAGMALTLAEGTVNLIQRQSLSSIRVADGAVLVLGGGSGADVDASALNVGATGCLDIGNRAKVLRAAGAALQAANVTKVRQLINTAFNNYLWDGCGITSNRAAADALVNGVLGVMMYDNTQFAWTGFGSVSGLTGNEVLLRVGYYGDYDANGVVDAGDYGLLDYYLGSGLNEQGDINGDGIIDGGDYGLVDAVLGFQPYGPVPPN